MNRRCSRCTAAARSCVHGQLLNKARVARVIIEQAKIDVAAVLPGGSVVRVDRQVGSGSLCVDDRVLEINNACGRCVVRVIRVESHASVNLNAAEQFNLPSSRRVLDRDVVVQIDAAG